MRFLILVAALLLAQMASAKAQVCSFSATNIDFGNVNVMGSNNVSTVGTFTATCTGTPNQSVRICANFNAGSGGANASGSQRYMTQGATNIAYNIYSSPGIGQIWGSYTSVWNRSSRPPSMLLNLGASGTATLTQSMYGRLINSQTGIPTGTFLSSFSGNNTQVAYNYSTVQNCAAAPLPNLTQAPFIVRLTNNSTCTVATTTLDFGTMASLNSAGTATNSVGITCTAGTQYEVGMSNGTSGGTGPGARLMKNVATPQAVTYGIYRDANHSSPWGDTLGSNTHTGTGTGAVQNFTGYGLIPAQPTPPALTYQDTVVVTVTY